MCEISDHRNKFTQQEDEHLLSLIKENGAKRWKSIARKMSGKTARQCRDRYMNYLREGLGNRPWTDDEDYLLSQKVKEIGTHWSKIVIFFKGRSTNNIKNRWYTFHLKKKVKPKNNYITPNFQNISFNNFANIINQPAFYQHQLNQSQYQFNQYLFNYPSNVSGQISYSSSPTYPLIFNMNHNFYSPDFNCCNHNNYKINLNSSPNIEKANLNESSFMCADVQSLKNMPEVQTVNFDNKVENDKDEPDLNNFLNYDLIEPLREDKKIKRIPSIYELLNPISES